MNKLLLFSSLFFSTTFCLAQSTYIPLNNDYYHLIDRYEIKAGKFSTNFHTASKPYLRQHVGHWIDSLYLTEIDGISKNANSKDAFNLQYLANDNWAWSEQAEANNEHPLWNTFFRKKADFFHVNTKDFTLHVNPVIYLQGGVEQDEQLDDEPNLFTNTRGLQIHGTIDGKIGFYTYLGENQTIFPNYVRSWIESEGVVPGEGFWKKFKDNGVDFFTARGYLSFPATRHIDIQMGYGRHFMGNGYRSLILSDFANDYLFLKINTQVWRIQYTNLFTEMRADVFVAPGGVGLYGTERFPKKYLALHRLGVNITDRLNIGLFETITFGQDPAITGSNGFELSYLIPVIFYRSIEQETGSPDNAMLGIDVKWNFLRQFSLYGQMMLDEFILRESEAGNGWWGSKYAVQLGLKYIDALNIPNLDVQLEHNFARPYAYAHESLYTNYAHYRQALAHPLGANFRETLFIGRYQPLPKLNLRGKVAFASYGADTLSTNWGKNIFLNYASHEQDFGNEIGQGIATDLLYTDLSASYQVFHNIFADVNFIYRRLDSEIDALDQKSIILSLALRWNIPQRENMF